MPNSKISIQYFAQYIRNTRTNTIEALHNDNIDIQFALGLTEKDVLKQVDNNNKLAILTYYNNKQPVLWVARFNKGGFAYGGFNTIQPVTVQELSRILLWVNYGKDELSDKIAKEYQLYGNP